MIDRSSNVSRLVEKLRQAGLAERVPHTDDRRMVVVTISDTGKQMLADIEQSRIVDEKLPGKQLTEAEAMELAHLLDKFRD
jgi:DNA-binding MarR family transcriptional regulator